MNRTLTLVALGSLVALLAPTAAAKDLLSPAQAQRMGLVEAWHRQVGTVGGARAIVDMQLWVQRDTQREYVEVFQVDASGAERVLERIATDMKNNFGQPIGKAEAERMAKMSVLRLARRSIDAQTRAVNVNQVRLYVLSSSGLLSAYDAESGEQLWDVRLGNPALGYATLGIDDRYVTVLNGTTMYQVVASDTVVGDDESGARRVIRGGRALPPTRVDGVPLHGAVHSGDYAVIPITRNGIETYRLDGQSIQPGFEMFSGQALTKPAVFPGSTLIMWPTDQEFVYAMETEGSPSTLFRLATHGIVQGGIAAASGGRFFFGSVGGRVYGIRATRNGEVLWNQSLGEPFYKPPFISGDQLLINSGFGNLHNLSVQTGEPLWERPARGVDEVFAHVGSHFVGRDRDHHLILIDAQSGAVTQTLRDVSVEYVVVNQETNRFYLAGNGGTLQCLRPIDSELPVFLRGTESQPVVPEEQAKPKPAEPQAPTDPFGAGQPKPTDTDPFGAGDGDPFGGGAGNEDPFGANPFGGGGGAALEDPF